MMRLRFLIGFACFCAAAAPLSAQSDEDARTLVARLDLEKYKATIKGLTQFGDRRQGTDRNRAAVDWIEAQLKSYGCTPTERIVYTYTTPQRGAGRGRGGDSTRADSAGARGGGGGRGPARPAGSVVGVGKSATPAQGGGRLWGVRAQTGVNTDSLKQPDPKLRALNM